MRCLSTCTFLCLSLGFIPVANQLPNVLLHILIDYYKGPLALLRGDKLQTFYYQQRLFDFGKRRSSPLQLLLDADLPSEASLPTPTPTPRHFEDKAIEIDGSHLHKMHTHGKNGQYTVGWICPLPLELAAAVRMLEDRDEVRVKGDDATYHVGRIRDHWVVMVVCPVMGTGSAATALANMRRSFPNIKHILVVGIAGGVPYYGSDLEEQICLGDVVVGVPQKGSGGVTHYEFGSYEGQGELKVKQHTLHPSTALLTAVNNLRSEHMGVSPKKIPHFLQQMRMSLNMAARRQFEDPGEENDLLYDDKYNHRDPNRSCTEVCDTWNRAKSRWARGPGAHRESDHPRIHYGTIGSANAVVKSSTKRNELRDKHGIICLEMEAAGIISSYQGLVIRGISDYADSHKNKKWQGYAAATAAAYARELLMNLAPSPASTPCGEPTAGPYFREPPKRTVSSGRPPLEERQLMRLEPPMPPARVDRSMSPPRAEPPNLPPRVRGNQSGPYNSHSHDRNHGLNLGPVGVNVGWCEPGGSRHRSSNSYDSNVGVNVGPVGLNLGWCGPGPNSHSHDNNLIGLNLGPMGHLNLGFSNPGNYGKGDHQRGFDTAAEELIYDVTNTAANLLFLPFGGARHY